MNLGMATLVVSLPASTLGKYYKGGTYPRTLPYWPGADLTPSSPPDLGVSALNLRLKIKNEVSANIFKPLTCLQIKAPFECARISKER